MLNFRRYKPSGLILLFLTIIVISFSCKNRVTTNTPIPAKVFEIRDYIRRHGKAPQGYIGGRKFKNLEKKLPIFESNGQRITYKEWDVNKKAKGKNRGEERLITSNNFKDYYTANHYQTFALVPISTSKQ